jgi:hypothetical protein
VTESASASASRKLVYDTVTTENDVSPQTEAIGGENVTTQIGSQLGATGGNETDEDKLKDSSVSCKRLVVCFNISLNKDQCHIFNM